MKKAFLLPGVLILLTAFSTSVSVKSERMYKPVKVDTRLTQTKTANIDTTCDQVVNNMYELSVYFTELSKHKKK